MAGERGGILHRARAAFYEADGPWYRCAVFEALGSTRYSRPALYAMDRQLAELLPQSGGTFVEVGAHDGYTQSNTYFLERHRDWSGVLIEAVPQLAAKCAKRRRRSRVFACALVGAGYAHARVTVRVQDLMSEVSDGETGGGVAEVDASAAHPGEITVPSRTLSSVLDEASIGGIDLMVLDVERRELDVLGGLDLDRHTPRYLLIEALDPELLRSRYDDALEPRMRFLEALSPYDLLYERV